MVTQRSSEGGLHFLWGLGCLRLNPAGRTSIEAQVPSYLEDFGFVLVLSISFSFRVTGLFYDLG